jgi:prepilin signal peptidase PulO-like enzyme (type II secretory pathway)
VLTLTAKWHHSLSIAVVPILLIACGVGMFYAWPILSGPIWNSIHSRFPSFWTYFVFYLSGFACVIGPPAIAQYSINRWLPAACPKCGQKASYRLRVPGIFSSSSDAVVFDCRSCGHREDTGRQENSG